MFQPPGSELWGNPAAQKIEMAISATSSPKQDSSRFAILKIRNFRYYCAGTIFSVTGEHIENVIRTWLIWELTHSPYWLWVMENISPSFHYLILSKPPTGQKSVEMRLNSSLIES